MRMYASVFCHINYSPMFSLQLMASNLASLQGEKRGAAVEGRRVERGWKSVERSEEDEK